MKLTYLLWVVLVGAALFLVVARPPSGRDVLAAAREKAQQEKVLAEAKAQAEKETAELVVAKAAELAEQQAAVRRSEQDKVCKQVDISIAKMRKAGLFMRGSTPSNVLVNRDWYGIPYKDKLAFLNTASFCYSSNHLFTVSDGYTGKVIAKVDNNGPQVLE